MLNAKIFRILDENALSPWYLLGNARQWLIIYLKKIFMEKEKNN